MASLYFHIPYCEHKCVYCDFYSIENMTSMEQFLAALELEIIRRAEEFSSKETIETIFFGGGTPSLLSKEQLGKIFNLLHKHYRIESTAEITCESNPGTVEQQKLNDFKSVGFNRISFGVQSFYEDDLKFLTRIHSAEEAERAVDNAYRAGFSNVNVDLIFALPNQTPGRWKENLRRAIALQPKHVSAYALIVEEQTPLATMVKNKLVAPLPPEEDAAMYEITIETLTSHGYRQYEVSNFAQPGFECRHNIRYWDHSNYLSFGPSAHSFWKDSPATGKRWWNVRSIQSYCESMSRNEFPIVGSEEIDAKKFFEEEIFLGLRSSGIDEKKVKQLFGESVFDAKASLLKDLEREGLVTRQNNTISLTEKGYSICDEIARKLM
ncbi:MAG: radical SAM family heme chaperone HemW [Ignavibacteriales bacterium]|nr:radical SAM family heme chaperone HemW [Ignavibacteriales bacterium]